MQSRFIAATLAVALSGSTTLAQTPGFYLPGFSPGTNAGITYALSQNGSVAAGVTAESGPGSMLHAPGYTWTQATGRFDFGLEPGFPPSTPAHGLSSDGSVVVGNSRESGISPTLAYRRSASGMFQNLGTLPNHTHSYAHAVSGDGNTVVGRSDLISGGIPFEQQAFRWTSQTGMQPLFPSLGFRTEANDISRDGTTVVGTVGVEGFIWRESTGVQILPPLPGSPSIQSGAAAVNADGTVMVGSSISPLSGHSHAVRWTANGIEDLGVGPGYLYSGAVAVDDSGDVIGGSTGGGGPPPRAFVWTPATGFRFLDEYLGLHGITVPLDLQLVDIYDISGDGLTFAGEARSASGVRQGFVATVPAPASLMIFACAAPLALRSRRRGIR